LQAERVVGRSPIGKGKMKKKTQKRKKKKTDSAEKSFRKRVGSIQKEGNVQEKKSTKQKEGGTWNKDIR